ncbi:TPA: RepB family plasmid replication initiator protein [Streptococcus suis]
MKLIDNFTEVIEISKNDYIGVFNIDEKLNLPEIKIFSYALYCFNEHTQKSIFSLSELEDFAEQQIRGKRAGAYIKKLRKIGITIFDEEFLNGENSKGKLKTISLISDIVYDEGVFTVSWNKEYADKLLGEGKNYTKIDLSVARKLSEKSWIFYEYLKIHGKDMGTKVHALSIKDLQKMYGLKTKTTTKYKYINERYLTTIKEELNKESEIFLKYEPIKEGKTIIGIKIVTAKNPYFQGHITAGQYHTLESIKLQLEELVSNGSTDPAIYQTLNLLPEISMLTNSQARKTIPIVSKKLRMANNPQLADNFEKSLASIDLVNQDFQEMLESHYQMWISADKLPPSKAEMNTCEQLILKFQDMKDVLFLAISIALENEAVRFSYVNSVLDSWIKKDIRTAYWADKDYQKVKVDYKKWESPLPYTETTVFSDDFLKAMNLWSDDNKSIF